MAGKSTREAVGYLLVQYKYMPKVKLRITKQLPTKEKIFIELGQLLTWDSF